MENAEPGPSGRGEEASSTTLDAVSDHLIAQGLVLAGLGLEDLLHLARASKRCARMVGDAQLVWRDLYQRTYGDPPPSASTCSAAAAQPSWRERFKQRFIEQAREASLRRKVRLIKLQSSCQALERDLLTLAAERRNEQRIAANLRREVEALKRQRQAEALRGQGWQPGVVQRHFDRITQPTSVPITFRLASLEQELKVCELRVNSIDNSRRSKQAALNGEKRKLAAMEA